MRASVSRKLLIIGGILSILFFAMLPPIMEALAVDRDSLVIGGKEGGKVKIRIDRHGISIEAKDEEAEGKSSTSIIIEKEGRKKTSSDIVRFGEGVRVGPDEEVKGDVVVFGGTLVVEGKIRGDAVVMGGKLKARAGSEINGDAVVIGGKLEEDPGALIQGERVVIGGGFPMQSIFGSFGFHMGWLQLVLLPLKFIFYLLLIFLVLALMGSRLKSMRSYLVGEYWKSFGWGILVAFTGLFALPVILILLTITIIGIPFALLLVVAAVVLFFIAIAVFVNDLGSRSADKLGVAVENPYVIALLGLVVLFLPRFIGYGLAPVPYMWPFGVALRVLGSAFILFGFAVGLGSIISSRFGSRSFAVQPAAGEPPQPTAPPDAAGTGS